MAVNNKQICHELHLCYCYCCFRLHKQPSQQYVYTHRAFGFSPPNYQGEF